MPQPNALWTTKTPPPVLENGTQPTETLIRPAERRNVQMRTISAFIFQALICILLGMLGAWIYQVALIPQNECIVIRKEIDEVVLFPVNDADADESSTTEVTPTTSSTPFFDRDYIDPEPSETPTPPSGSDIVSQLAFTRQEQEQAMITEVAVMPLHCKITKPDGFGTGTTVSMVLKAKKDAKQIDIFFKNPAGVYTFDMQLRWLPFENSVFFTTQSEPYTWNNSNDHYESPNPLEHDRDALFNVTLLTRPKDMLVTLTDSKGVATTYTYKHKEGINQADSYEAILSGNVKSVSQCKVL